MENNTQSYDDDSPNWEHRGMLAVWALHEVWLLCRERTNKLLTENKISTQKHTKLLKKFDTLYGEASSRNIKTSADIMLIESDVRVFIFMLCDLGINAMQEMLKLFDNEGD